MVVRTLWIFPPASGLAPSWRIGQTKPCRVVYFYFAGTMQSRAMALMGRKLTAAQALEGKFSSEGLAALAGEYTSVELALARSLVNRMDEGDAHRACKKDRLRQRCASCTRRWCAS